jgi:hypothetical protein
MTPLRFGLSPRRASATLCQMFDILCTMNLDHQSTIHKSYSEFYLPPSSLSLPTYPRRPYSAPLLLPIAAMRAELAGPMEEEEAARNSCTAARMETGRPEGKGGGGAARLGLAASPPTRP